MLAKGMEHRPVTRIFSSPLKRALQTAQIIGESRKAPVEIVEDLQEVDFGRWEGLTWEQARQQDPEIYKRWLLNRWRRRRLAANCRTRCGAGWAGRSGR